MKQFRFASVVAVSALVLGLQAASAETLYSARKGDTLTTVAKRHQLSVDTLLKANPAQNAASQLAEGLILVIPDGEERAAREDAVAPKATAIRIEGATQVAVAGEDEFVLDRSGDYRRRPSLNSRRGMLLNGVTRSAHRFMGTPYVFGGTSEGGIDCSGFTMRVFMMNGIRLPRTADVQYSVGSPVGKGKEEAGDLVFFETYCPGPSHVGIYLGGGNFIHASSSRGVTVSNLSDSYYRGRYLGAKRVF
ncbi:MAG: LysM peptidoglycan-binding domain-containing C40 family peptidase [Candidatus Eremiobacteraeota bacterium]|nr:LysM peptidoglycan-binding domain-containing C40 family peptidase [Candidatus Eremiobacteraeota bacterium]